MNIETNCCEQFILSNNKDTHIVVFSYVTNLKFLCSIEKVLADGTFNYCKKYFL